MTTAIEHQGRDRAYVIGWAVAIVTALLLVWTTIVRDDGNGAGFFLVILAVGVGAFACWFRADGMARAMFGVAAMQVLFGLAIATAPVTVSAPGGIVHALIANGVFAVLWLVSAVLFRMAAAKRAAI